MPRVMVTLKLTEQERALLRKRSGKHDLSEADYLRMAMVFESTMAGDASGWSVLGEALRQKAAQVFSEFALNAPARGGA